MSSCNSWHHLGFLCTALNPTQGQMCLQRPARGHQAQEVLGFLWQMQQVLGLGVLSAGGRSLGVCEQQALMAHLWPQCQQCCSTAGERSRCLYHEPWSLDCTSERQAQALMPWALQPMSSCMCARAAACAAVLRSTGRDWRAAKGFGATVTCTGFQLALHTPWPSHVVSTTSQAALWACTGGSGVTVTSPGHGCDRWTLEHAVAWEQLCHCQCCRAPRCTAHSAAGPAGPSPKQMQAVVLMLQEPDHADWGVEAVPWCCCLPRAGQPCGHKSWGYLCHISTSVAVVRCSFRICLSLQIINVACSGHPRSRWNKCHMPNDSPASGCFAKWSHSYGKISYTQYPLEQVRSFPWASTIIHCRFCGKGAMMCLSQDVVSVQITNKKWIYMSKKLKEFTPGCLQIHYVT